MLTRRAVLTFFASAIDQAARICVQLIITPLLLTSLGDSVFGYWQILIRSTSQILPLDGRSAETLKWIISRLQNDEETYERQCQVSSAIVIWFCHLPILIFFAVLTYYYLPLIIGIDAKDVTDAQMAGWVLTLNIIIMGAISLFDGVFRGMNIGYKRIGIFAFTIILGGVLIAIASKLGGGIKAIAMAQVCATFLYAVIFIKVVARYLPWLKFRKPNLTALKGFYSKSIWFMSWEFLRNVIFLGEVLILGIYSTSSMVATYTVTAFSIQLVTVVALTAVSATLPGFGKVLGMKQYDRAVEIKKEAHSYLTLIISSVSCLVILINAPFVGLWVGSDRFAGDIENLAIVISGIQLAFIRYESAFMNLGIDIKQKVIFGLISAVLGLIIGYYLIPPFGILGLCVTMILARLPLSVAFPKITYRLLMSSPKISSHDVIRNMLRVILFLICWVIGRNISLDSWAMFILYAFFLGSIMIWINYLLMSKYNRKMLHNRLSAFLSINIGTGN